MNSDQWERADGLRAALAPHLAQVSPPSTVVSVIVGMTVQFVVSQLAGGNTGLLVAIALGMTAGAAAGAATRLYAISAPARQAAETFLWVARQDWVAFRATYGAVPHTPRACQAWLASHALQATGAAGVGVAIFARDIATARRLAADLPARSPVETVEREILRARVGFIENDERSLTAVDERIGALAAGPEQLRRRAERAVLAARFALADDPAGSTWQLPLRAIRPELGPSADSVLRREWLRSSFAAHAVVEAIVLGVMTFLARGHQA